NTVIMFAYAYCRGNGFTMTRAGDIVTDKPDITAAIVAGATRYVANPTGLEYRAGTETVSGAFSGWTLAEQAVLNNYRKRWARSEEHTSELQSRFELVCRLLLDKKK